MAQASATYPVIRASAGELTNPVAGAVLADSGPLDAKVGGSGIFEATVIASASAAASMTLRLVDIPSNGDIGPGVIFYVPAGGTVTFCARFHTPNRQCRLEILLRAALIGQAVANLFVQRVG